jgi:hypothetical protein
MKKIFTTLLISLVSFSIYSQSVLKENFNYTVGNLTGNGGWSAYNGSGVQPVKVINGGLTLSNYVMSDTDGKAVKLNPTAQGTEDVWTTFSSAITTGPTYLSFLAKIDLTTPSTNTSPVEFITLASATNVTVRGRLCAVETSPTTYKFRLIWGATSTQFVESSDYTYGTTYLVVLKYDIFTGTDNDKVSLYVFNSAPPTVEPTPVITPFGFTGDTSPGALRLQQNGPSGSSTTTTPQNITIDGIAVTRSWNDFFNSTLPISLLSFSGKIENNNAKLNWKTSSEKDNDYFEIIRRGEQTGEVSLGKIYGKGNSTSIKDYYFTDYSPLEGNNYYSLKQVDKNGESQTYGPVAISFKIDQFAFQIFATENAVKLKLNNKEPNSKLDIRLFNMNGAEVYKGSQLLNSSGFHDVNIPINLEQGLYIVNLQINGKLTTGKFLK